MQPVSPNRLLEIQDIFKVSAMDCAWKKTVRTGLRSQPLQDLHDYLDVHRNIRNILQRVRADIQSSSYRPNEPELATIEKRDGILRRLVVPTPTDAIVLQTLVDAIEPVIKRNQPSQSAFYSRSHSVDSFDEFEGVFGYPWWLLWPEFQQRIWKFSRETEITVTTDLANFFDTIPLRKLRDQLAAMGRFDASVLDLLFYVLEAFIWRPDYIPLSGVGLPQINFDAPRLLAHAYLFEADALLHSELSSNFVRWMDDIDFGVETIAQAREILSRLDALLSTLGVRLNTGKTKVLTAEQAAEHFWIEENVKLNVLKNVLNNRKTPPAPSFNVLIRRYYAAFLRTDRGGQRSKVAKRYLSMLGRLADDVAEKEAVAWLENDPGLRDAAVRYLRALPPTPQRVEQMLSFCAGPLCIDDASFFSCCKVLSAWRIPARSKRARAIVERLSDLRLYRRRPQRVASVLWPLTKYASQAGLARFVDATFEEWKRSEWAARQVAKTAEMLPPDASKLLRDRVVQNGLLEALRVITNLEQLKEPDALDRQLRSYLEYDHTPQVYPLPKFLTALTVLKGRAPKRERKKLKRHLLRTVNDPVFEWRLRVINL